MNQREKDIATARHLGWHQSYSDACADGAEFARKQLLARLLLQVGGPHGEGSLGPNEIQALAKEYGL